MADPRAGRTALLRMAIGLVGVASVATTVVAARGRAEPLLAYAAPTLRTDLDSLTTVAEAARRIDECTGGCVGVVYSWSPRMPLSRAGIAEISVAARDLGIELTLIGTEALHAHAPGGSPDLRRTAAPDAPTGEVGPSPSEAMLRAGILAHAPALVVHRDGRVVGPAILGYKTAEAYERLIGARLREDAPTTPPAAGPATDRDTPEPSGRAVEEYEAVGSPGAYFRWVPGRHALAYEAGRRIYLLDLLDGRSLSAPGFVDFVPTPDGRYFVTPGPGRNGLSFYDANEVFADAGTTGRSSVTPFFEDPRMQDQYPSVGILERGGDRTVYRVLTSWFTGVVYRDYEIRAGAGGPRVRPIGDPVTPCRGSALSIPIMSQDGAEVAARDEATATTKIFRMLPGGRCEEVVDLGVQTSKVAWHATGRLLAFAAPRLRPMGAEAGGGSEGIYLFDLDASALTKVADSEVASPLAFPEFIGDGALVYLIPRRSSRETSVFRVIEGIR